MLSCDKLIIMSYIIGNSTSVVLYTCRQLPMYLIWLYNILKGLARKRSAFIVEGYSPEVLKLLGKL
jgi:hypothetical protein